MCKSVLTISTGYVSDISRKNEAGSHCPCPSLSPRRPGIMEWDGMGWNAGRFGQSVG
jgi:hypothetical protein